MARSPQGALVPVEWLREALDRHASDGEVEISVESVGHRSAFVGAVLAYERARTAVDKVSRYGCVHCGREQPDPHAVYASIDRHVVR